jgi:adenosylcobinamide-GDP ribazoletransferase
MREPLPPEAGGDNLIGPNQAGHHQQLGDKIMPPIVYETAAWLRFYTALPVPPLPGEVDAAAVPDPARSAYPAPIAAALIGLAGGLVIAIAAALGATNFVAAALGVLALVVITGGQPESMLAARSDRRLAAPAFRFGVIAIAVVVLLRTGAIDALLVYGVWKTVFTLVGAFAISRAAALMFVLMRPAATDEPSVGATAEGTASATSSGSLQWLAIAGLAIGIVAVLPFHGLGAAVAGIAAAAGTVALVSAFLPRDSGEASREFTATAELLSEIAFLVAVVAFASVYAR